MTRSIEIKLENFSNEDESEIFNKFLEFAKCHGLEWIQNEFSAEVAINEESRDDGRSVITYRWSGPSLDSIVFTVVGGNISLLWGEPESWALGIPEYLELIETYLVENKMDIGDDEEKSKLKAMADKAVQLQNQLKKEYQAKYEAFQKEMKSSLLGEKQQA